MERAPRKEEKYKNLRKPGHERTSLTTLSRRPCIGMTNTTGGEYIPRLLNTDPTFLAARMAALVESSNDAIISKTLDGMITSWNKGAERIFGYEEAEVIGKSVLILIPRDLHVEEPLILERIRKGERIEHYETVRVAKDGHYVDISLTVSPVKDSEGNVIGVSKIARDITARKEVEQSRQLLLESERAARKEAERVGRIKDEFLATLSHELRTPLNAIMGWTHLLQRKPGDFEMVGQATEVIDRNSRILTQLISDLLDMSRIISGKMRIELQPVHPAVVIESALDSARSMAEAKQIEIQTIVEAIDTHVYADPGRLQQMIWNLLSNSVKFTPTGGEITLILRKHVDQIEISISDSGIGIKSEFLPHIFEKFSQQDATMTRKHGGLGIGLALVKELAELHGGTVRATSAGEGKGSTFSIFLPIITQVHGSNGAVEQPDIETPEVQTMNSNLPDLANLKVLLIDDDEGVLVLMVRLLEDIGVKVFTANSATVALDLLDSVSPDVLISDT